jgi:hypothetical protein
MYELPPREVKWVERMLNYNVTGGKMNRGLMVVESVQELAKVRGMLLELTLSVHLSLFNFYQHYVCTNSLWGKVYLQRRYPVLQFLDGQ